MLYVCIPAYNEAATVGVLLWRLRTVLGETGRDYEVVVYDDGSTDETAEVLAPYRRVLPLTLLGGRDAPQRGRTAATEALLRHVAAHSRYPRRDACVVLQADFTDRAEDVPALLPAFDAGADVVVGRRLPDPAQPPAERRLRRMGPWVLRPLVRVEGVDDLLTSFRLYRVAVLRDLVRSHGAAPITDAAGWAGTAELLAAAVPLSRRVDVVDVPGRYDVRPRASRLDWAAELRTLARYAWRARGTHARPGAPRPQRSPAAAEPPPPHLAADQGAAAASTASAEPIAPPRAGRGERPRRAERPARADGPPPRPVSEAARQQPASDPLSRDAGAMDANRAEGPHPTSRRRRQRATDARAARDAATDAPSAATGPLAEASGGVSGAVEALAAGEALEPVPDAAGEAAPARRKKRRRRRTRDSAGADATATGSADGEARDRAPDDDVVGPHESPDALAPANDVDGARPSDDADPGEVAGDAAGEAPAGEAAGGRRRKRRRSRSGKRTSGVAPDDVAGAPPAVDPHGAEPAGDAPAGAPSLDRSSLPA